MIFCLLAIGGGILKSRVFISCGQSTPEEQQTANKISAMLEERGFAPYVAKNVQTVFEIDSGIIRELKNSDCYLLITFCREKLRKAEFRGSLFSNQELAIAYALGFEPKILVVIKKESKRKGCLVI